ncbi:MAG TPA: hypothetical protein VNL14_16820 [Candidatus Acidoferrales bacterium]|nr:hypothetical protein [Candidatus Acidoferrales bacterium]
MEDALDILEGEGMKRARATSDTLLIFFLKSHRREIYGEQKQVKVGGLDGGPLKVLHDVIEIMDDEEDGEGKK